MEAIMTSITAVVEGVVGFIALIVSAVVAQPLLLIPIGMGLLRSGVGLVKKFMH